MSDIDKLPPITECQHCESDEGYYFKTQIKGACESRYTFDGNFDEESNSDIHDDLTYKDSKYTYCRSCHKRLFHIKEMEGA